MLLETDSEQKGCSGTVAPPEQHLLLCAANRKLQAALPSTSRGDRDTPGSLRSMVSFMPTNTLDSISSMIKAGGHGDASVGG